MQPKGGRHFIITAKPFVHNKGYMYFDSLQLLSNETTLSLW